MTDFYEPPRCVDCKYYRLKKNTKSSPKLRGYLTEHLCKHGSRNVVSGEHEEMLCLDNRTRGRTRHFDGNIYCGREARFFEPKETS